MLVLIALCHPEQSEGSKRQGRPLVARRLILQTLNAILSEAKNDVVIVLVTHENSEVGSNQRDC